jgi:hypothetical protein
MVDPIAVTQFVLGKLEGIIKAYSSQKRDLFVDHIEPLQEKMIAIHKDYISGFQEVRGLIKNDARPSGEIIEFLRERRREYDSQRQLSRHLAEEIEKAKKLPLDKKLLETVSAYCDSIVEYLNASSSMGAISWYSHFIDNVRFRSGLERENNIWEEKSISGNPRDDLLGIIDTVLDKLLPRAFDKINATYAALRVKLL